MHKDFEQMSKSVLDAEQQWKENIERINQEISTTEFHDILTPDFERFQAIEQAQNQAPLDIVAELKTISRRLDAEHQARIEFEEKADKKSIEQGRTDTRRFIFTAVFGVLSFVAGAVAAVAAVLALIPR